MKKQRIAVSILVVGGLVSPLAYATNGDEMMAVGSQSTALGGTGVANYIGAESLWANPAMLGKSKGAEVTGGVNLFKPKVTNTGMPGGAAANSTADTSYIPDVSYSRRIDDDLSYGVAMAGIAGMGVDYTGANPATHIKAKSALSILRVVVDVAYNKDNYGVGFAPIFQSGSLMLSYNNGQAIQCCAEQGFQYRLWLCAGWLLQRFTCSDVGCCVSVQDLRKVRHTDFRCWKWFWSVPACRWWMYRSCPFWR